jgi:hypothetical protein
MVAIGNRGAGIKLNVALERRCQELFRQLFGVLILRHGDPPGRRAY